MGEKENIISLYRKRAKNYDLVANLYNLIGLNEYAYRVKAVKELNLKKGDTVIELACGTGLNFISLQKRVGKSGKIIGIDVTDAMLEQAKERIKKNKWKNVVLVKSDIADYKFPKNIDGVISTYAITLSPEFDKVIKRGYQALLPGGRMVILDFKMPNNWLTIFVPFLIWTTKPFGIRKELAVRHPWESIKKYFPTYALTELYGGIVYISRGIKGEKVK